MRRIRRVAANAALAALLDHHLLGPAMAKTLAHGARLDARLQRQGFGRNTQCLVARRFRIDHSAVPILFKLCVSARFVSAKSVVSYSCIPLAVWPASCRRQPSGIGPESGCVTGMSC